MKNSLITADMLNNYYELSKKKKEVELEMDTLKEVFHHYFDQVAGPNDKGEISIDGFKLLRQVRKLEKFNEEITVKRLEELKMNELIKVIKKPDDVKIKAALNLGLLNEKQLEGCMITTFQTAISVKSLTPR